MQWVIVFDLPLIPKSNPDTYHHNFDPLRVDGSLTFVYYQRYNFSGIVENIGPTKNFTYTRPKKRRLLSFPIRTPRTSALCSRVQRFADELTLLLPSLVCFLFFIMLFFTNTLRRQFSSYANCSKAIFGFSISWLSCARKNKVLLFENF